MSQTPALPIEPIPPGTMLVVGSDDVDRAQSLGTFLLSIGCNPDDGMLFVSTDTPGDTLLAQCDRSGLDLDVIDLRVITGAGNAPTDAGSGVTVEETAPTDLTGLGIKFSVVYENLSAAGSRRILAGIHTLSTILEENDLRTVVRFLNTVSRRVEDSGGLIVFVIDSNGHGQETLSTLSQVCDGYIEVRDTETDDAEIRIHGLPDQPEDWVPIPAGLLDPNGQQEP